MTQEHSSLESKSYHCMTSLQCHCKSIQGLRAEAKHCYLCLDSKVKCSFLEWQQIPSAVPCALWVHPHLHLHMGR